MAFPTFSCDILCAHVLGTVAHSEKPHTERVFRTRKPQFENPKLLASEIACAITVFSENPMDWVARNGKESLFGTVEIIVPGIGQPEDGRHRLKGRMTRSEFNKYLQAECNFVCARTRKQSLASTAGNWLFCNRRWLNPLNREERITLESNYEKLCVAFPIIARCSKKRFIQCVMDVSISWSDRIEESSRKCAAAPAAKKPPTCSHRTNEPPLPVPTSSHGWSVAAPHDGALRMHAGNLWYALSMAASHPPYHIGSSADASPYDSAEEGPTRGEPARSPVALNAGEAMDASLHEHWASSVPALRVDARELEQFGRSKSF